MRWRTVVRRIVGESVATMKIRNVIVVAVHIVKVVAVEKLHENMLRKRSRE